MMRYLSIYFAILTSLLLSCASSKRKPVDSLSLLSPKVGQKTDMSQTPNVQPLAVHPQNMESSGGNVDSSPRKKDSSFLGRLFSNSGKQKFKNTTVIVQSGEGNTAASATKPGTMATGTEATATNARKADAVVVGDGSQAAKSSKGPAVAGEGNTTTDVKSGTPFWVWVLVFGSGFGVRHVGPWVLRQLSEASWIPVD